MGLLTEEGGSKELFSKIEFLKILVVSGTKHKQLRTSLKTNLQEFLTKNDFIETMMVSYGGEKMQMFSKKKELIFIKDSNSEYVALYIFGEVDEKLMKDVMRGEISFK